MTRRWKPETRREIVMRLRAEGQSIAQIAKYLGISPRTVCYDVATWVDQHVQTLMQDDPEVAQVDCIGGNTP